jgi:hypothetical protein
MTLLFETEIMLFAIRYHPILLVNIARKLMNQVFGQLRLGMGMA